MLKMCKETPVTKLKAISGHLSAGAEECHKNSQGKKPSRFEWTSHARKQDAKLLALTSSALYCRLL